MTKTKGRPRKNYPLTSEDDRPKRVGRLARIISLLKKRDYTPTELIKETRFPKKSVYRYIEELRIMKLIESEDDKIVWSENKKVFQSKHDYDLAANHSRNLILSTREKRGLDHIHPLKVLDLLAFEPDRDPDYQSLVQHFETGYFQDIYERMEKYRRIMDETGLSEAPGLPKLFSPDELLPNETGTLTDEESISSMKFEKPIPSEFPAKEDSFAIDVNSMVMGSQSPNIKYVRKTKYKELIDLRDLLVGRIQSVILDVIEGVPLRGYCDRCPDRKITIKDGHENKDYTGYAYLDKLLCGGLRSNIAVVLISPSCTERDSLIKSFLKTGAERSEVTFYLTTSARAAKALAEKFQSDFYLFVCNPQADAITKSSPNVFKLKGVESLTEISIALTSAIRKLDASLRGPRRACIEIVSDVLLQHHAVQTRKWLTALTTELTSTGFTVLAVVDPEMHPSEELHSILGLFDGEINIYQKGAEKFLRIKRMSDQKYLEDELLLTREGLRKQG